MSSIIGITFSSWRGWILYSSSILIITSTRMNSISLSIRLLIILVNFMLKRIYYFCSLNQNNWICFGNYNFRIRCHIIKFFRFKNFLFTLQYIRFIIDDLICIFLLVRQIININYFSKFIKKPINLYSRYIVRR